MSAEHTVEKDARRRVRKIDRIGWTFLCRACRHGARCGSHGEAVCRAQAHTCHDHEPTGACVTSPEVTARPPLPPTDAAAYQWPDMDIAGEENEARAKEWDS